jgi:hypothetical protein
VKGTTPEELAASAAQAARDADVSAAERDAAERVARGRKVQVKGVLNRQNKVERINVMSLDSVGAACGG